MQITNAFRHPVVYVMPVSASYRMDGQFILCVVLGPPFISSLGAREPVSYTHLDVYKRQVLGDPKYCEGCRQQIDRLIGKGSAQPQVAAQVRSVYLMLSMVAAGVGLALMGASQVLSNWELGIASRPLAEPAVLTTWLLRSTRVSRQSVARFIERVIAMREDNPAPPPRAR